MSGERLKVHWDFSLNSKKSSKCRHVSQKRKDMKINDLRKMIDILIEKTDVTEKSEVFVHSSEDRSYWPVVAIEYDDRRIYIVAE